MVNLSSGSHDLACMHVTLLRFCYCLIMDVGVSLSMPKKLAMMSIVLGCEMKAQYDFFLDERAPVIFLAAGRTHKHWFDLTCSA